MNLPIMDDMLFLKENDKQERVFLCCSKSEIVVLLDSIGMNPGKEKLSNGFLCLEKGKAINLDRPDQTSTKIRIDKITNGSVEYVYTDLTLESIPHLSIPVRNILEIIKEG